MASFEKRLGDVEKALGDPKGATAAIVCVDASGQWRQDGEPTDREELTAKMPDLDLIILLRELPADYKRQLAPA